MEEEGTIVERLCNIAKNIPFCSFFYKYLLTLLREYYIGKGGMVNIPQMLNVKNLYYEKNLLDYGSSAHWFGQCECKEK